METASMEMPRYKSHKTIWALKIKEIAFDWDGTSVITPAEDGYAPIKVDASYMLKHKPQVGGYYVVYADGYKSFSPAKAFEEGYTPIDNDAPAKSVEQSIQAAGADSAPRVTPADIEAEIASEHYFTAGDGHMGAYAAGAAVPNWNHALKLLTFCVLILRNGHRIVGVNEGPVSAENFDSQLGRKLARQNAIDQIWPLLGFRLRDSLHQQKQAVEGSVIGGGASFYADRTPKYPVGTVAALNDGASVITVDDHCYVLKNLCDGEWRMSGHIFQEALEVMKSLPKLS